MKSMNVLVAVVAVSVMGLSVPNTAPDADELAALTALVEHVIAERFPTSHEGRQVAVDLGSVARVVDDVNPAQLRKALEEKRPIESLGADPARCREQKCWQSAMYIEFKSWEQTATGYEAIVYVLIQLPDSEGYNGSANRYSLEPDASGWTVTLAKALLRN